MDPPTISISTNTTHRPHHMPHIASLPNETISFLTPYSGLLVTIWMVILFGIKNWILEIWLFPKFYKETLSRLNDGDKRGFLVHHISAGVKVVLLIVGAKPFCDVVFGKSTLHDPYSPFHRRPTMGDILLVLTQLFVALFVFELFTRKKVSPINSLHHVGAVIIAQSAVVLSLDLTRQVNASMEFVLCLVWAAFDVLSELWLNLAFITYRIYPTKHSMLAYIFGSLTILNLCSTFAETVMVMTLFGGSWSKWELDFKVVTPILHTLFTIAQLHTSRILFSMWTKEKKRLYEEERHIMDPEGATEDDPKKPETVQAVQVGSNSIEDQTREGGVSSSHENPATETLSKKPSWLMSRLNKFFTGR